MIIKQNAQYELHATLTPYGHQQSLVLSQILQVLLTDDELAVFSAFLSGEGEIK